MEEIEIRLNDYLFNAGMVGFYKILKHSGKTVKLDNNRLIFNKEDLNRFENDYIDTMIYEFMEDTAWYEITREYNNILGLELDTEENKKTVTEYLKKLSQKMERASYKSGVEIVKSYGESIDIYNILDKIKKEEDLNKKREDIFIIIEYLKKYKEVFCMKDIIYTKIDKYWQNVAFLNSASNKKDIKQEYKKAFLDPVLNYINVPQKGELSCIGCGNKITKTIGKSMSWLNDIGVDASRKTSMFWNFNPDIFTCPICTLIYSCIPLGFIIIGQDRNIYK